ncbi:ACP S-malonyltransferase, partial [Candidatus Deferrimicrobium sp.]|uniref:ACP S-malonyltransferase n=1 Tax=Candidatus Deferrimicrobium sp. TaxID=3060586 RepID=UPI003C459442
LPLPVSAPFHCALMRPAADRLAPELRAIPQGPFAFPVVANVTAAPYGAGDVVADILIRQITAPVRWEESVVAMRAAGADAFIEVGPGTVLSGLLRRIERDAATAGFCGPADLDGARGLTA